MPGWGDAARAPSALCDHSPGEGGPRQAGSGRRMTATPIHSPVPETPAPCLPRLWAADSRWTWSPTCQQLCHQAAPPSRDRPPGPCSPQGEGVLALRRAQQKCLSLVGGQAGRALGHSREKGDVSGPLPPHPAPPHTLPGWASGQKDSVSCLHCPPQRPHRGSPPTPHPASHTLRLNFLSKLDLNRVPEAAVAVGGTPSPP